MTNYILPPKLKWSFTVFMLAMVPVYVYEYGPSNLLNFCDTCLLIALAAVWTDSPLLASIPAVGIIIPQTLWIGSFISEAMGTCGPSMAMFDTNIPLWLRGLTLYHCWFPFMAAYMTFKLGYDRRAIWWWLGICWTLLVVCYFTTVPPPAPAGSIAPVNINFIYGFSNDAIVTTIPLTDKTLTVNQWLVGLLILIPTATALPMHLILRSFFPAAPARRPSSRSSLICSGLLLWREPLSHS